MTKSPKPLTTHTIQQGSTDSQRKRLSVLRSNKRLEPGLRLQENRNGRSVGLPMGWPPGLFMVSRDGLLCLSAHGQPKTVVRATQRLAAHGQILDPLASQPNSPLNNSFWLRAMKRSAFSSQLRQVETPCFLAES